jgi:Flp pilus assembly protein TadD
VFKLANAAHGRGDLRGTFDVLKRIEKKVRDNLDVNYLLGVIAVQDRNGQMARQYLQKAWLLAPNNFVINGTLANFALKTHDLQNAVKQLTVLHHCDPKNVGSLKN